MWKILGTVAVLAGGAAAGWFAIGDLRDEVSYLKQMQQELVRHDAMVEAKMDLQDALLKGMHDVLTSEAEKTEAQRVQAQARVGRLQADTNQFLHTMPR